MKDEKNTPLSVWNSAFPVARSELKELDLTLQKTVVVYLVDDYNRCPFDSISVDNTKPITESELQEICAPIIDQYIASRGVVTKVKLWIIGHLDIIEPA